MNETSALAQGSLLLRTHARRPARPHARHFGPSIQSTSFASLNRVLYFLILESGHCCASPCSQYLSRKSTKSSQRATTTTTTQATTTSWNRSRPSPIQIRCVSAMWREHNTKTLKHESIQHNNTKSAATPQRKKTQKNKKIKQTHTRARAHDEVTNLRLGMSKADWFGCPATKLV